MLNTRPLTLDLNVVTTLPVARSSMAIFGADTPPILLKSPPT